MTRLTTAQALVRFLANQWSARDGKEIRLVAGCFGIFGHGNVAGLGQALVEFPELPYMMYRNEQAMVHAAAGYARMQNRLSTFACTTSIGPGATNLVTGAAGATINRLPVLLLPGDFFASRSANPLLQELEDPRTYDISVNDCLRPVSRYWDRISRPEQLLAALPAAMRVLTDPADTGAVTLALPQDVQAEAFDWPNDFFDRRVWHVPRPAPDAAGLSRATAVLRRSRRPLLVAGGGVAYSDAVAELRGFAETHGVPVAVTQAGKGTLPHGHPLAAGAIGVSGTTAANILASEADVVIGVGTRYTDFTTASRTLFAPDARFININITSFDAVKLAAVAVVADAKIALSALTHACAGWRTDALYQGHVAELRAAWAREVTSDTAEAGGDTTALSQSQLIAAVNAAVGPHDVVVCAAGSMPGDLHKLWRCDEPASYHVEYGYSCMGYEIPGGMGVKLAAPDREVFVLVGDGSYLMMPAELATAVAAGIKLIVILVDNHGFASIGRLSERVGAERLGTSYRDASGRPPQTDLAANAESLGAVVHRARTIEELRAAIDRAIASDRTTVIHVETDPTVGVDSGGAWWEVPVAEVATTDAATLARLEYEKAKRR